MTLSTTESKYYAMSELCSELLFIKQILVFLNMSFEYPMVVRVDNIRAMFLANNSVLSQQTKHISVRYHFIREYVAIGMVKIIFVRSKLNTADIFTKILGQELFLRHRDDIMDGRNDDKWKSANQDYMKNRNDVKN